MSATRCRNEKAHRLAAEVEIYRASATLNLITRTCQRDLEPKREDALNTAYDSEAVAESGCHRMVLLQTLGRGIGDGLICDRERYDRCPRLITALPWLCGR